MISGQIVFIALLLSLVVLITLKGDTKQTTVLREGWDIPRAQTQFSIGQEEIKTQAVPSYSIKSCRDLPERTDYWGADPVGTYGDLSNPNVVGYTALKGAVEQPQRAFASANRNRKQKPVEMSLGEGFDALPESELAYSSRNPADISGALTRNMISFTGIKSSLGLIENPATAIRGDPPIRGSPIICSNMVSRSGSNYVSARVPGAIAMGVLGGSDDAPYVKSSADGRIKSMSIQGGQDLFVRAAAAASGIGQDVTQGELQELNCAP